MLTNAKRCDIIINVNRDSEKNPNEKNKKNQINLLTNQKICDTIQTTTKNTVKPEPPKSVQGKDILQCITSSTHLLQVLSL